MISICGFKRVLICFLIISVKLTVWAQDSLTPGDTLKTLINATFENETAKLFVHYDKTVYLPNETIWFTAYLLNKDTARSNGDILSVAIIRSSDRIIAIQKKFVLTGVVSSGSILIPDSIATGDYSIIAYTNRFIKNKPDAMFIQRIAIKRPEPPDPKPQLKATQVPALSSADPAKISIKFYPEGGDLVSNLPQYVGWEAKDGVGAALKLKAALLKDGQLIDTIETSAYGMGRFFIKPKPGSGYAVRIISATTHEQFNLPSAVEQGIALTMPSAIVRDTLVLKIAGALNGKVHIVMHNTTLSKVTNPLSFNGKVHIVIHNTRKVFYALTNIDLNSPGAFKIALDSLPRGLAAVTVYDKNLRPCAERIFFAHYNDLPAVGINVVSAKYGKRQKVTLKLGLNPGNAAQALVSIACVQANRVEKRYLNDIDNYGYLDKNLNSIPESLNGSQNRDRRKEYLENILLIRGWRRYSNNAVPDNTQADSIPHFRGSITVHNKQPRKLMILTLMGKPGTFFINTDNAGWFTIPNEYLLTPDDKPLALFATGDIAFNTRIKLTDPFAQINQYLAANLQVPVQPAAPGEKFNDASLSITQNQLLLKEVKIRAQRGPLYRTEPTPGMHTNACGDYVGFCGALNCQFHGHTTRTSVPIQGHVYYRHGPVKDGWIQYNIPIVYNACETKNQSLIRFDGVNLTKEYYPYSEADISVADPLYNSTLYWGHQISLTKGKGSELSFYTGDISGIFSVIVQGITTNGVVYSEEKFEVVK